MKLKKALLCLSATIALVALLFTVATFARQDRKFPAPTPDIHASKDPAILERGRYLVLGPAHCSGCHGAPELASLASEPDKNEETPLSGGVVFELPVGTFRAPNITSDEATGLGRYRDEDIARMLRHGVRPDGRVVLPFMPFADLTDEDLTAIVSYVRTLPPVRREIPPHELNAKGRIAKAWILEPRGPSAPPKAAIERGPTAAYGKYLAHSVANCVGCHTKLDLKTGELAGPLLGGGALHPSTKDPAKTFVAPNLTPDRQSGWIAEWSEDLFVARMKVGRVHEGSPMPWPSFARMSDDDLRALYKYLRTVPPVSGGPDPADRASVIVSAAR